MTKAVILDVDGVIVGEKVGFNFPNPHPHVTSALKSIRTKGIPVIFCTAKPLTPILKAVEDANLHNVHIADAGAVLYDPIDRIILEEFLVDKKLVEQILPLCLNNQIYTEFYTRDDYYMQKDQENSFTEKHAEVLQFAPVKVPSLIQEAGQHTITKIMMIAKDEEEKQKIVTLLEPFSNDVSLNWGNHPYIGNNPIGFITNKAVSKKIAVEKVIKSLHLDFPDVLSVGDSTSDWQFMQLTGYVGTLENAKNELKELVKTKGEGNYCIGKSVDENGILDIFQYFQLI